MSLPLQYLHVIGIFQGVLLCSLLAFGQTNSSANRVLGVWCLTLALSFIGPFITLDGELNAFSGLIGWSYFLPASYGAFLYLYCRSAITGQRSTYSDLWYFSPLLVSFLLNIDILVASPQVKLAIVLNGAPDSVIYQLTEGVIYIQAFAFLGLSTVLVRRYHYQATQTLANFNPHIFSWLWKLLVLYFAIWMLKLADRLLGNDYGLSILGDLLIVVMIYSIAMAQWRNPRLFIIEQLSAGANNSPQGKLEDTTPAKTGQVPDPIEADSTKQKGALDESIRASLLSTLTQHMEEQQMFLDSQLTLTRLSDAINISTHHLSEVLNQQLGKNFYQFINEYRVNYVCQQLQNDHSIKVLDLAMSAGFSSKSTFNAVFKQAKGMTPTQYRKSL